MTTQARTLTPGQAQTIGWAGMGCILVFTLPFALGGLFVMFNAFQRGASGREFWMQMLAGSIFALIGIGMTAGAAIGVRSLAKKAAIRSANPDEPWKWREDWARGVAADRLQTQSIGLWIFAVIWTLLSSPVILIIPGELEKGNKLVLVALLFPLVGLLLLSSALFTAVRNAKYGRSVFHFDTVPIAPGRTMRGTLRARLRDMPAEGIATKLTSIHRVVSGSGKNSSTTEHILWQEEKVIPAGAAAPNPEGVMIPISYALPRDGRPTDETVSRSSYHWRLRVTADVPGIDYAAEFEVPVFGEPPRDAWDTDGEAALAPERPDTRMWTPSAESGITISRAMNGAEVFEVKRTNRNFASLLFPVIWFGAMGAMLWFFDPPGPVVLFLGFVGLIISIAICDALFGWTRVEASKEGVVVHGGLLVYRWTRRIPVADIREVKAEIGASSSNNGGNVQYSVRVSQKNGTNTVAATWLRQKKDAEMLAARISDVAGV